MQPAWNNPGIIKLKVVILRPLLGNCIQQITKVTMSWTALATMGLNAILYCIHVTSIKELLYAAWSKSLNTVKTKLKSMDLYNPKAHK